MAIVEHPQESQAYRSAEFDVVGADQLGIRAVINAGIAALPPRNEPTNVREIRDAAPTKLSAPSTHRKVAGTVINIANVLAETAPEISEPADHISPNTARLVGKPLASGAYIRGLTQIPGNNL